MGRFLNAFLKNGARWGDGADSRGMRVMRGRWRRRVNFLGHLFVYLLDLVDVRLMVMVMVISGIRFLDLLIAEGCLGCGLMLTSLIETLRVIRTYSLCRSC